MMIVQNGCRVRLSQQQQQWLRSSLSVSLSPKCCWTDKTQLKLYKLSQRHPKICSEPAVVLFQLFNEEDKLYLSIPRG